MKTLTLRQQQILDLIKECYRAHQPPPTRSELARKLGLRAVSTVEQHLQALVRKGYLAIEPGLNRNIRLLAGDTIPVADVQLPLVGRVAAGAPILAEQHIDSYYALAPGLFRPKPDYLLRVEGMSMRDAGIFNGDLLVVHRSPMADNGQVIVARLGDEVTVKRLELSPDHLRLLPENPDFEPIDIDVSRDEFVIEGIAVGIIRNRRL